MLSGRTPPVGDPRRCAVLGHPIGHSLSPAMHRAAYAHLGLDGWRYEAADVDEHALPAFVGGLGPDWRGLSLTMPLKRAVLPLLDEVVGDAADLGVVNTVLLQDGRRCGHNTDVPGARAALAAIGAAQPSSVRVLGAGATAASVLAAVAGPGLRRVEVAVRDASRAVGLVAVARVAGASVRVLPLGDEPDGRVDLLVSTVPVAAVAGRAPGEVSAAGAVLDAVYDPWPTPLAATAAATGVPVASGLDLLAHQAALQVGLMTGRAVDPALLLAAAGAALTSR